MTVSANNHASPTGSLPFLIPASSSLARPSSPVSSNKILQWVESQSGKETQPRPRNELYSSLVDHGIRNAWLHFLYLDESNFRTVAWNLYLAKTSSNRFVQVTLGRQLQQAAREELLKTSSLIDADDLYTRAAKAFQSLSSTLGDDIYFFGNPDPGLLDASVFAYTHLLLDQNLGWQTATLVNLVKQHPNLVHHRSRLLTTYFERISPVNESPNAPFQQS